ncbi:MAG: hypothetical protein RLZZ338_3894 [Cyanobacteriota bacterium]|jgi:hypothetical protein
MRKLKSFAIAALLASSFLPMSQAPASAEGGVPRGTADLTCFWVDAAGTVVCL